MDAFYNIHLEFDTTLSIIMEASRRGHSVFHAEPKDLFLLNRGLFANASEIAADRTNGFRVLKTISLPASAFNAILVRKDPPFDLEYLNMTYLLDFAKGKALIINDPEGIRSANEKLFSFRFHKFMPESLATNQTDSILQFQKKIRKDLILKPLNRKAGEGILLLGQKERNKASVIRHATKNDSETILAQEFIQSGLTEGDKRILIWDGVILGAFQRIPKRGEFRSNLSLGGTMKKTTVTAKERRIISALKPILKQNGLIFVGLDLVGEKITEINVTSPAGIPEINELNGQFVETKILDWIEKH